MAMTKLYDPKLLFFFHYSIKSHIFDCLLTFAKQKFIANINAFPVDCSVAKDLSLDKLSITLEQNGCS